MSIGKELGACSYTATSMTLIENADGSRTHQINYEGTAAGYGTVLATMRVHVPPNATFGRGDWSAAAYLESGGQATGRAEIVWSELGRHQWRIRGFNLVSDGAVILSDGVIDLATRTFKGTLYAWD